MRGDEVRVVDAFCRHLETNGWSTTREVDFCDVIAERDGLRIYAEAKGRTAAVGLDVDTLYGQLLRRMPITEDEAARFAVVVPTEGARAAARVPERLRALLKIDLYVVDEDGTVSEPG